MIDTTATQNELLLATLVRIAEALEAQNALLDNQTDMLRAIACRIEDVGGYL